MQSVTPEEKRRKRLKELAGWLQKEDSSVVRVLGRAQVLWGCTRETARDYLKALEDAGLIEVLEEEDEITWLGR